MSRLEMVSADLESDDLTPRCVITVQPAGIGWSVKANASSRPQMFHSRQKAEASAFELAERIGALGIDIWIEIHSRGDDAVSRTRCSLPEPARVEAWGQ